MWKFLKSPLTWLIGGIALIVLGYIYNDEEKYPAMPIISKFMIILGALVTGFASVNFIKWNPFKTT